MFALTVGTRWSAEHAAIHSEREQSDIHTTIEVARDAGDKRERFSGREAQVGSSAHFVIADVGPLVSLALATLGDPAMMAKQTSYLDLLKAVGHPIEIVDQVTFECIYSGDRPEAAFVERWIERHAGQAAEVVTTIGCDVAERRAEGTYRNGRRKGELTTNGYLREFRDYRHSEEETVLVLFEDARVARLLDGVENVHMLTTSALLRTLARSGLADYDHVTEAMRSQRDPKGRWTRSLLDYKNELTNFVAKPKLTSPAGSDADVRAVLEQYSTRGCSSLDVMRALQLEWKGDLVRALNSSGLSVPLGDVAESARDGVCRRYLGSNSGLVRTAKVGDHHCRAGRHRAGREPQRWWRTRSVEGHTPHALQMSAGSLGGEPSGPFVKGQQPGIRRVRGCRDRSRPG